MNWNDRGINQVGYLENKDNYISINTRLDATALRVKVNNYPGKELANYKTFIVMGNHKETVDNMNSDLEIMEWFAENENGSWSDCVEILKDYISNNFIK